MHTVQYNVVSDVEKMTHAIAQLCHGTTVVDMLLLLYMWEPGTGCILDDRSI